MKRLAYLLIVNMLLAQEATLAQTNSFPNIGKVGIGTTNPSNLLTINTGGTRDGIKLISGVSTTGGLEDIYFTQSSSAGITTGQVYQWQISLRNDGYFSDSPLNIGQSLEFYGNRKGGGYFAPISFTSGGDVILVSNKRATSGNVLIGKVSQINTTYKLDVNGTIHANKIVVNTTGADFVFDSSYQMFSIDSLTDYIREYHHLPGILSSKKMQKQGLNLGNNQIMLLKKIEELTLYLIEMKKEQIYLRKEVKQLKKQNQQFIENNH